MSMGFHDIKYGFHGNPQPFFIYKTLQFKCLYYFCFLLRKITFSIFRGLYGCFYRAFYLLNL